MNFGGPPALPGAVHLVGAGPGDPGLLTLRGARLLQTCTLVASDRLVASELLDLVPPAALRFEVGKRCRNQMWSQERINRLLVEAARDGHAVVRLKGGDPFVLGRGGEEAAACVAAGLPFEVVPGVTSAVAAPAAADIPVTHRGLASGFAVITGHEDPTKLHSQVDWGAVAVFPGTLVVLMGLSRLSTIADLLMANGRDPATPAAAVRWGTTPGQQVVEAPLGELAEAVTSHGLEPPVTVIIGEVVGMRAVLAATPALVGAV
ncbi:MAG: uroporphyrinogen-III C-methyltransferase [Actinomycetota bacterium]|nr:uroporphyrinogen-III C-methyltransferase [Actinomycetota bacterium]